MTWRRGRGREGTPAPLWPCTRTYSAYLSSPPRRRLDYVGVAAHCKRHGKLSSPVVDHGGSQPRMTGDRLLEHRRYKHWPECLRARRDHAANSLSKCCNGRRSPVHMPPILAPPCTPRMIRHGSSSERTETSSTETRRPQAWNPGETGKGRAQLSCCLFSHHTNDQRDAAMGSSVMSRIYSYIEIRTKQYPETSEFSDNKYYRPVSPSCSSSALFSAICFRRSTS